MSAEKKVCSPAEPPSRPDGCRDPDQQPATETVEQQEKMRSLGLHYSPPRGRYESDERHRLAEPGGFGRGQWQMADSHMEHLAPLAQIGHPTCLSENTRNLKQVQHLGRACDSSRPSILQGPGL